jgi:hypothetical protein
MLRSPLSGEANSGLILSGRMVSPSRLGLALETGESFTAVAASTRCFTRLSREPT